MNAKKVVRKEAALLAVLITVLFAAAVMVVVEDSSAMPTDYWAYSEGDGGWSLDGTTYTISTANGLAYIAEKVNGGDSLSGKTVVLSDNIDLSDHLWTPIGNSESLIFAGIFNGDNKTIEGLTINYSGSGYVYSGLFGYVKGTSDTDVAVIKNVSVGGNVVVNNTSTSDKNYAGGIVGYVDANVEISYCSFSGSVSCTGAHSNYA